MFGLGFISGLLLGNSHGYHHSYSNYGMESELRRKNQLKEQELKQQREQAKRQEWLDYLKSCTNEAILKLLNNTDEYIEYNTVLSGGLGNKVIRDYGKHKELNSDYVDIKKECFSRGLLE